MDAPEKIKVAKCHPFKEPDDFYVCHPRLEHPAGVEYTRSDLCLEMVAAAYEDAAEYAETCQSDEPWLHVNPRKIRAITPADAQAALAARDGRIREAALREAYVNLKTYRPHEVDGPEHDVGYTAGYVAAMNRVEALISKDKADG